MCRPFAPECSSITKIEWLQRSPRVPPQLQFSNLRLGEETATRRASTRQRSRAVHGRKTSPLNWVPLNQDDPAAQQMFWSSQRASQPQTYVTNANSIDGGSNIVHRPISPRHAIMHCVPLYCIQPLYRNTATIQPEEVMSEAWGLYVGAPAERSGEIDKWEYAERIVQREPVRW